MGYAAAAHYLGNASITNTVRYTLENGGNTLIETETSVGPLGPEHNIYVLNRYGAVPATNGASQ